MIRFLLALCAVASLALAVAPAQAQATRTWVSGVGDDVNPCSRTAPCKTFAGAISKTAAGGEINCLDPAGYGAVTITKSITIDCTGTLGSILNSSVHGVFINAGPTDAVILRGIAFQGVDTGLNAVRFIDGRSLQIENCFIQNSTVGVMVDSAATTSTSMRVTISNTMITGNTQNGIVLNAPSITTRVMVRNSVISDNSNIGILVNGPAAMALVSGSTIVGNDTGVLTVNGGQILSYGNNNLHANITANGAFSGPLPLQ